MLAIMRLLMWALPAIWVSVESSTAIKDAACGNRMLQLMWGGNMTLEPAEQLETQRKLQPYLPGGLVC